MMLALALVALIVFWRAPFSGFLNYDDDLYVTNNFHVANGLNPGSIAWAFTSTDYSTWTPLTWLSLGLDTTLFNLHPAGYHLTNLLLHIVNSLLLFLLLRRWTGDRVLAFLPALFWTFNPLNVETVMWISERKGLLSTTLGLLALIEWSRFKESGSRKAFQRTHLYLSLSLLAKPMLVTFPAMLLLIDLWPYGCLSVANLGKLIREKLGFILLCTGAGYMAYYSQKASGAVKPDALFPFDIRFPTAVGAYFNYVLKAFLPLPTTSYSIFYPVPVLPDIGRMFAGLAVIQGLLIISFRCLRSRPAVTMGLLWFLGTLVPVIGAVKIGIQAPADRYMYVPLIGLLVAASQFMKEIPQMRRGNPALLIGFLVLIGCLQAGTASRYSAAWKNSISLFEHARRATRPNPLILNQLGLAHSRIGESKIAIHYFEQAIRLRENNLNLADGMAEQGELKSAIRLYHDVLRFQPDHPRAHNNLGIAYARMDEHEKARHHWIEAINHGNAYLKAYDNLATSLIKAGDPDSARAVLTEAIKAAKGSGKTNELQRFTVILDQL